MDSVKLDGVTVRETVMDGSAAPIGAEAAEAAAALADRAAVLEFDGAGDSRRAGKAAPPPWSLFSGLKGGLFRVDRDDATGLRVFLAGKDGGPLVSIRYDGPNDRTTLQKLATSDKWKAGAVPHAGAAVAAVGGGVFVDSEALAEALAFLTTAASSDHTRPACQALHVQSGGRLAATDGHRAHYLAGVPFLPSDGAGWSFPATLAAAVLRAIPATRCKKVRILKAAGRLAFVAAGPFLTVTVSAPVGEEWGAVWTVADGEKKETLPAARVLTGDAATVAAAVKAAPVRIFRNGADALTLRVENSGAVVAVAHDGATVAVPLETSADPDGLGLSAAMARDYFAEALAGIVGTVRVSVNAADLLKGGRFTGRAVIVSGRTGEGCEALALVMPLNP